MVALLAVSHGSMYVEIFLICLKAVKRVRPLLLRSRHSCVREFGEKYDLFTRGYREFEKFT